MPNWCCTDYVIEGKKDTLDKIYEAIENHSVKEGSSEDWEGNILETLGIDYANHFIRGFIEDSNLDDDSISIYATEAWARTDFAELLLSKFQDIDVYWKAEEPGMDIYETNDSEGKYFPERYLVDILTPDDYIQEYFELKEDVYKYIEDHTGCRTDKEIEEYNSKDDYHSITIHEFKVYDSNN